MADHTWASRGRHQSSKSKILNLKEKKSGHTFPFQKGSLDGSIKKSLVTGATRFWAERVSIGYWSEIDKSSCKIKGY
ncbi:hypothetical protein [Desulfosarcina widdelii]|uniref:hypothetical protein n=1 Tax=Desulfosarcina widdelii TaxID=947919 RepID=UPI0012D2ACF2|nr:hypothetical protein [Desulfosarcina widdelii]